MVIWYKEDRQFNENMKNVAINSARALLSKLLQLLMSGKEDD